MATCFEILWKKSKVISSWVLDTFLFRFCTKFEFNWLESFAAPKITSKSFENVSSLPTVGKNERSLKNDRTQNCPTTSANDGRDLRTYIERQGTKRTLSILSRVMSIGIQDISHLWNFVHEIFRKFLRRRKRQPFSCHGI